MKIPWRSVSGKIYAASIHCAARLLRSEDRATWIKEWTSELWYVHKAAEEDSLTGSVRVVSFCRGAFCDAFEIRKGSRETPTSRVPYSHSARHCLWALVVAAGASVLLTLALPSVRKTFATSAYRDPHTLVMISRTGFSSTGTPSIPVDIYREWRRHPHRLFSELAVYQVTKLALPNGKKLVVANVSANLFSMLGVSRLLPSSSRDIKAGYSSLLLSPSAWHKYFNEDRNDIGKTVPILGRNVVIGGVFPDAAWMLLGEVDAWLIEPDGAAAALDPAAPVFMLGSIAPDAKNRSLGDSWHMSVHTGEMSAKTRLPDIERYDCVSLSAMQSRPFNLFLFGAMLAILALPATTPLSLGEYPRDTSHLPWKLVLRRWGFLVLKLVLALPIVFFVTLDLTHIFYNSQGVNAQYLQIISTFALGLAALRWSLRDQRSRCPVCLCKLTNTAHVGESSRNFLAWHAMELICVDGHGLLHVPEMPTCWFPTQRWTNLDASWSSLFISSI